MKDRNRLIQKNCIKSSAACIEWDLDPIPCLDIQKGDMLDDVTLAIVRKLCEREDEFDLESITLNEIVERLNTTEPADRTIKTLLQFCVDNDVKIHKLFTQLRDSIPGASGGFVLDLKCFKKLDSYGNQVAYDEQTVLQDLINEACKIRDEFEDLREFAEGMGDGDGGSFIEPIINGGCLGSDKRTSAFVSYFASEFCGYRNKVGTAEQIDIALGKQGGTETFDSEWIEIFQADPNFYPFPTSLAQGDSNQWMAINNLGSRVLALESCACKVTCKDLDIGFGVTSTDNGIILEFAPQYGNSVNEAFSLTGSNNKVSFTDKNGKRMTFNITSLQNEDTAGPFDISKLAQDDDIIINVCVAFTTPQGEYCNKCVQDIYDPATSNCNFCEVRATGPVTIMYKSCSTDDYGVSNCVNKVLRLSTGDDAAIRKSYLVTYISDPDALEGMECLNMGEFESMGCYIYWTAAKGERGKNNDVTDIIPPGNIIGVKFKGQEYTFPSIAEKDAILNPGLLLGNILSKIPSVLSGNYKFSDNEHQNAGERSKFGIVQLLMSNKDAKDLFVIRANTYTDGGPTSNTIFSYSPFIPRSEFTETTAVSILNLPESICTGQP